MKQLETDVVVVAAGLSGLAASVAAAESGARVITLEKASNTGGAANMGMGPAAAGSPLQKASMIEVTPGELFRRHMFYTHYQVDARLVRDYYFKSGDTIQWLMDMGVEFNSVRPAFRARERTRAYADGEYTWHVVQPEDGSEPGPRAATTMTKRMTERAQELGVEFMLECPGTGLITNDEGAVVGVTARDKDGEEYEISCSSVIVATGGFGHNTEMIKEQIGLDWGENLFSFAIPGMDGDGLNMCHAVGAGHTPVSMEMMYQIPDNMNHFYVEGAFRQPCYWCNRMGERFMPEDEIFNTTFVGNAINHLPGKVAFAIFDSKMLKHWKKDGPDIVSHVHPHDLYEGFDEQWERVIDTNVNGVFYVAREVGKVMLAQGYGKIINIGSFHCQVTMNGLPRSGYSTAKGAVYMMTKALAAEWAKSGITVNTLGPGYFKSEMADAVTDESYDRGIRENCPMGRRGNPGELNGAMLFLASDASSYVTGQLLLVDGGWTIV